MKKIKSTQELRESIQTINLKSFLDILNTHKETIIKMAKSDVRFRQVIRGKLNTLKQHSKIDVMYFEMVA